MLKKIAVHNYVTGHVFTFVEYLVVVGVLAPFLALYLSHGRILYAAVASGIILNCLTISIIALFSVVKREPSIGIAKLRRDPDLRRKVASQYPNLGRLTVLIPFWMFLAALLDTAFRRQE